MKKILSIFLTLIIIIGIVPIADLDLQANATQDRSNNFYNNYEYSADPGQYMVNIALAQKGRSQSSMGYTEAWCANFVSDCARLAGQSDAIPAHSYVPTLWNNIINAGGREVYDRRAGDIIFYDCSACDTDGDGHSLEHVGIVIDSTYSVEGNLSRSVKQVSSFSCSKGHTTSSGIIKRRYLRPNYQGSTSPTNARIDINPNGGTAQSSFYVNYGEKCNLTIDSAWYPGYALEGWNLYRPADSKWFVGGIGWCTSSEISANGYEKSLYSPNLSMTLDSSWYRNCSTSVSVFTFFAVWKEATYTININANGGTAKISSLFQKYNKTCNLSPDYVRQYGYELAGWNLYRPADGKWFVGGIGWCTSSEISANGYEKCLYAPNLSMNLGSSWFTGCNESVSMFTFYAVWREATYTVNINANGGTSKTSSFSVKYNTSCNLSLNYVQRDGYKLAGWNLYRPADGKWFVGGIGWRTASEMSTNGYTKQQYVPNLSMNLGSSWFTNCSTDISSFIFYAVWTANTYIIKLNTNGGNSFTEDKTVTYNSTYGELPVPTREGYMFEGWFTEAEGGTLVTSDTIVTAAADHTLYAHWSRFAVKEGSTAVIDGSNIYGLKTKLTAANIKNTFLDYEGVEVTLTKAIEDARYYGTGSTVTVKYSDGTEEVYTIIIFGDIDGNAIIDSDDAFSVLEASYDNSLFNAAQKKAANVDGVRRISIDDYSIINDAALGISEIDQTAV